jgi:hypothetical protein
LNLHGLYEEVIFYFFFLVSSFHIIAIALTGIIIRVHILK